MKSYSPKEIIKILKNNDWKLSRVKGDHYIFKKYGRKNLVVIPTSKNTLKIGTLKSIEKQIGIKL